MPGKTQIKYIQSLRQKKYRHLHGAYLIEGEKIAGEYIASGYPLRNIYAVSEWIADNRRLLQQQKLRVEEVSDRELKQMSSMVTPNNVLAEAEMPAGFNVPARSLPDKGIHLLLESIQDPGNLGTIIRTADWFGIDGIYCSPDCADAYNPKTVQSAMGSLARTNIQYFESAESLMEQLSRATMPVYAATPGGKNIFAEKLSDNALVLLGNESKGLSLPVIKRASHRLGIPRFGKAESLNVAVAAAIFMARFRAA